MCSDEGTRQWTEASRRRLSRAEAVRKRDRAEGLKSRL